MIRLINGYIISRFLVTFSLLFLGIFSLIVLFDSIELNRSLDDTSVGIIQILSVSAMRAPSLMLKALPFVVLLAVMMLYARLARTSEITVMRASGISSRGLVSPVVITSALLGVATFGFFHPVSAWLLDRSETYQASMVDTPADMSAISISKEGLWLRQGTENFETIIHAKQAFENATRLKNVTFYRYDMNNTLLSRMDALTAVLDADAKVWRLQGVRKLKFSSTSPLAQEYDFLDIPTNLTPKQIADSFSETGAVSFWGLPAFINNLEESGFTALTYILTFQSLLSLPLTYVSMVIIAAAFSMRPRRFGGLGLMALASVVCGFVYYFIQDVSLALGSSETLSPILAVWTPPLSAFLLGTGLLLHMEDT